MNRRILKKKTKEFASWFSKNKIPMGFKSEKERKQWCSEIARLRVGQKVKKNFKENDK